MRRLMMFFMCFTIVFAVAAPNVADAAKPRGGYKSPKGNYQQPAPKQNEGVTKTQPANNTGTKAPGTAATTTPNRGFFSGGLAKGLLIGGLAGMLFGGMFGGMGFMGQFLGLLVNVMGLVILFMIIRSVIQYFANRRKYKDKPRY